MIGISHYFCFIIYINAKIGDWEGCYRIEIKELFMEIKESSESLVLN